MNVAVCLSMYGVIVAVLGPPLLVRLTHGGIVPRLGVAAWLAAIVSAVLSVAGAAVLLLVDVARNWDQPDRTLLSSCFSSLRDLAVGGAGVSMQLGLWTLAVFAALALSTVAWRAGRVVFRMRAHTLGHARAARIIGHRLPGLDAVIVDAPEPAAYCVAGRPHAIVVTSSALGVLDRPELAAVLAHERAHISGRHHQMLAALRGLAAALPNVTLLRAGAAEVARLLEMCADDAAARTHGNRTLLGGLIALAGAAGPVPAGALGATSVDVLARAGRLVSPAPRLTRIRVGALLSATTALIVAGPIAVAMLTATGMALCGTMNG